jgi:phage shock protein E
LNSKSAAARPRFFCIRFPRERRLPPAFRNTRGPALQVGQFAAAIFFTRGARLFKIWFHSTVMSSSNRYQQLTADAKTRIREITVQDIERTPLASGTVVIDVREAAEWRAGHAVGAIHLSRGLLEGSIEEKVPDLATPILLYCAGGNRSALAADSLQKMGYTNVTSLAGGFAEWQKARLPIVPGGSDSLKV